MSYIYELIESDLLDFLEDLQPVVDFIKLIGVEFNMKFGSYQSYNINFKPFDYRKWLGFAESGKS